MQHVQQNLEIPVALFCSDFCGFHLGLEGGRQILILSFLRRNLFGMKKKERCECFCLEAKKLIFLTFEKTSKFTKNAIEASPNKRTPISISQQTKKNEKCDFLSSERHKKNFGHIGNHEKKKQKKQSKQKIPQSSRF